MKKFLLITGAVILFILLAVTVYIYSSGPDLPPETDEIIGQVLESELPEVIKGNTGFAKNGEVSIWYESIDPTDTPKGTILIIMGITNDGLAWPDYFIQAFVDAGYRGVRYDHRGTGLSDWMEDWSEENFYTLDDMSDDGFAIMDDINVELAHVIGLSMGGMIAQTMAINNPERVISLTSIMSSGYIEDPELPGIDGAFIFELAKVGLKYLLIGTETNMIKMSVAVRLMLQAETGGDMDIKNNAERILYNLRKRNGFNYNVSQQHLTAVSASGSRYDDLKNLQVPALIIHGKADPMIPFAHGLKCAGLIPDADTLWIENMGHDITINLSKIIVESILNKYYDLR
jgi:pimeloyl-ACP methyl ester carboxylesterase